MSLSAVCPGKFHGTSVYSLIRKAGEARDRTHDPLFTRRVAVQQHHRRRIQSKNTVNTINSKLDNKLYHKSTIVIRLRFVKLQKIKMKNTDFYFIFAQNKFWVHVQ